MAGAQSDLEKQIANLRHISPGLSSGSALADAQAQLNLLAQLQRRITTADATTLLNIRSEVAASVAASQSAVQQAQSGAGAASLAQMALTRASEDARKTTNDFVHDFYDKHEFDKYLKFTSANDEEEYRKREAERHKVIEEALAKKTPEGNLEAAQLSLDQLKDAGAHGANRSSEYESWEHRLTASRDNLSSALRGQAPQKANASNAQADPLDNVAASTSIPPEVIAQAHSAGIVVADQNGTGHGITANTTQAANRSRGG